MLRGFLVKGWMTAVEKVGAPHLEQRMNTIQCVIWDTILDPLWQEHNEIKHWKDSKYNVADDERLSGRIVWYVEY